MTPKAPEEALLAENHRLSQELKQRLFELSILYDISNKISYTLDYNELLKLMMDSLHKIVDYDVCASLLLTEEDRAQLVIKITHPVTDALINEIKQDLIKDFFSLTQKSEPISSDRIDIILRKDTDAKADSSEQMIRSSFDVPLFSKDTAVGMLSVNSTKEILYSDDDIKLLYTIATEASSAIERLKALIAAEKSKMKAVVDGMTEGIIMTDEKNELAIFNPAARKMLGFGTGELRGVKVFESLSKLGIDFKDSPTITELSLHTPYPQIIHSEITSVTDKDGKELGKVATLRDVTKERQLDKMKSDFVSVVSHELRTPLAAMRGATENLLDEITGDINALQKECLSTIKRNIERLSRLINDLLDISKMEAGMFELILKPYSLSVLIDDAVSLFEEQAKQACIVINKIFVCELPMINLDGDKITQVITNLVGNAIKFTPAGGEVTIKAFPVIGKSDEEGDCVQVDVIDTGIGIAPPDLERVFDKFYQVTSRKGHKAKGTGLGLTITKGIIEKHGGRIWASSEFGKGSTFSFTLPIVKRQDG